MSLREEGRTWTSTEGRAGEVTGSSGHLQAKEGGRPPKEPDPPAPALGLPAPAQGENPRLWLTPPSLLSATLARADLRTGAGTELGGCTGKEEGRGPAIAFILGAPAAESALVL